MGIDVWLALEAFELAIYKRFDVSVLIAGDGDFFPLVRKLNTLGTRVMLLAWDFKFMDANQQERETRTAQVLLDEVTYPVMMHQVIDDRSRREDPVINNLFLPPTPKSAAGDSRPGAAGLPRNFPHPPATPIQGVGAPPSPVSHSEGTIKSLKDGYGFIAPAADGDDVFFYCAELSNTDFNDLTAGDRVRYAVGRNARGPCAVDVEVLRAAGGEPT